MKRLLILGAGIMQVPVIQKARQLGLYTIVADYDPEAIGFKDADQYELISTNDYAGILKLAQKENIDGILTTSDAPVNIIAAVGEELGLTVMPAEVAKICTNKYLQRELFVKKGIHTPFFKLCYPTTELNEFTDFPYIVKPVDSSASRGVKKVNNRQELEEAFQKAFEYSREGKVLVESFIEGREFSVETLTQNGQTHVIAITEKWTRGETLGYFVEDTHLEPARISEEEAHLILTEVLKAIGVIGLDNCPSHTEIKLNANGVWIIEIACRLGGDYITSDLVPLSTGVDMLENLIRLSLNEPIDITKKQSEYSCVQFLNEKNYFKCRDFILSNDRHMCRYEMKPYSDSIIKNSLDRLGYIILQAETLSEIETILKKIKV